MHWLEFNALNVHSVYNLKVNYYAHSLKVKNEKNVPFRKPKYINWCCYLSNLLQENKNTIQLNFSGLFLQFNNQFKKQQPFDTKDKVCTSKD